MCSRRVRPQTVFGIVALATLVGMSSASADVVDWPSGTSIASMRMGSLPSRPQGPSLFGGPALGDPPPSAVILDEVPTCGLNYGSSAASAGMIFGYYDRHGYGNMWAGGMVPLYLGDRDLGTDHPIIATPEHVTDYWISYDSPGPDPWEGNWPEHTWADCTADFMGTSQWKWKFYNPTDIDSNEDGTTTVFYYENADKLYDYIPPPEYGLPQTALSHGMHLFAESRGYQVEENYTQQIDTVVSDGFSFADYMNEIDNGYPVMLHLELLSTAGVGYDEESETVYLHDTGGDYVASMPWGGPYLHDEKSYPFFAVTVFHLVIPEPSTLALLGVALVSLGIVMRRRRPKAPPSHRRRGMEAAPYRRSC